MKKFYLTTAVVLMGCAPAMADYVTADDGTEYTLAKLAEVTESGLTMETENTFLLSGNLTIMEKDALKIEAGETLLMADGVEVLINGEARFNPESKAYIMPSTETARPKGWKLAGKAVFKNMDISGGGFKYSGTEGLLVEDCDFHDINSESSMYGVIVIMGQSPGSRISGCTFTDCEPGAINTPANLGVGLIIEDNEITNVSTLNGMRPFINVTANAASEEPVIIRRNIIKGAKLTAPGGIGVSNMLNTTGPNKVIVEYNTVTDCSWGLNFVGGMDVRIVGNTIKDNCWDTDVNGGIAITLYSIASYPLTAYAQGNLIEGNKWGPCTVGASVCNFGKTEDPSAADYNPGENVFRGNKHEDGEGNMVYVDFCNNSPVKQYAQGNYWNDANTEAGVAATIQDNNFSSSFGEVVYTPFRDPAGVEDIENAGPEGISIDNGVIRLAEAATVSIYDLNGRRVASSAGAVNSFSVADLNEGLYIALIGKKAVKFVR